MIRIIESTQSESGVVLKLSNGVDVYLTTYSDGYIHIAVRGNEKSRDGHGLHVGPGVFGLEHHEKQPNSPSVVSSNIVGIGYKGEKR